MAKIINFPSKIIKRSCENCSVKTKLGKCPHLYSDSPESGAMLYYQEKHGFCLDHEFGDAEALGIFTIAEDEIDHSHDVEIIQAIRDKAKADKMQFDMMRGIGEFMRFTSKRY